MQTDFISFLKLRHIKYTGLLAINSSSVSLSFLLKTEFHGTVFLHFQAIMNCQNILKDLVKILNNSFTTMTQMYFHFYKCQFC